MAYRPIIKLPRNHHKEDAKWLESQLMLLNEHHQIQARAAYSDVYSKAYSNESTKHKKLNKARREANIRMRKFVSACLDGYQEHIAKAAQPQQNTSQFDIGDL